MAQTSKRTAERAYKYSPEGLALEIINKGIHDEKLLNAFTQIDRKNFVPLEFINQAYEDEPLIIGHDQVTTQPSLIAQMVQSLKLTGHEKVLEIGTGFGFQTAVLALLCQKVFSIERFSDLAMVAEKNLRKVGIQNSKVVVGDGTLGLSQYAPFDAIIISAAAPQVPRPLVRQLRNEGMLVQPIGKGGNEIVTLFQKLDGRLIQKEQITAARFVPMIGTFGVGTT